MSELLVLRRPRPPAIVPPLLSFTAGFIDSFTVLALFGLFVAQVTGSFVLTAVAIVTNEPGALTKLLAIPVFLLAAVAPPSLPSCSNAAAAPRWHGCWDWNARR